LHMVEWALAQNPPCPMDYYCYEMVQRLIAKNG
jgi:hypothetical protein